MPAARKGSPGESKSVKATPVKDAQVHMEITCADGREVDSTYLDVKHDLERKYQAMGRRLIFAPLSVAGTFIGPNMLGQIKHVALAKIQEVREKMLDEVDGYNKDTKVTLHIHLKTHGDFDPTEQHKKTYSPYELTPVKGAVTNCGMLGVESVAKELEKAILELKPSVRYLGEQHALSTAPAMRDLIYRVYGQHATLTEYVTPFENAATHAARQKSIVTTFVRNDHELSKLGVIVHASVHDYCDRHSYALRRVDGRVGDTDAIDEAHEEAARRFAILPENDRLRLQRTQKQAPVMGLIHDGSETYPRPVAYRAMGYAGNMPAGKVFAWNQIPSAHAQSDPVSALTLFFLASHYSPKHLVVLAKDESTANRMTKQFLNDPLNQATIAVLQKMGKMIPLVTLVNGKKTDVPLPAHLR